MPAAEPLEIRMSDTMRAVTLSVRVTGARRAAFRLWLGGRILALAAAVMGCGIEVSVAGDES